MKSIPNEILFAEVKDRLARGEKARILLVGTSMTPVLENGACYVTLSPLDREAEVGDVVLASYRGREILHRIIRISGDAVTLQGDNCYDTEAVQQKDILALLTHVDYRDGRSIDCSSPLWQQMSRRSLRRKRYRNLAIRHLGRDGRKRLRPWYFLLLAILMWAPLNGLAAQFPNYVLGLRADHFVHASIYILCAPFLMDLILRQNSSRTRCLLQFLLLWACCGLVGITTECGQMLLPYRGYDVNDLVANFIGATLGCIIVAAYRLRRARHQSSRQTAA